ncbi:MAG: barstar family protein [Pseudonocardiaceae bacterium]
MNAAQINDLLSLGRPAFSVTEAGAAEIGDLTRALAQENPSAAVRRVRGSRARTMSDFFDEMAATLQFPAYFGANWHALYDCLADLGWLPATAYLLVIEDADLLLVEEPDEILTECLRVLANGAAAWQGPQDAEPPPSAIPFQIVLQAPADGRIARSLRASGTAFEVI